MAEHTLTIKARLDDSDVQNQLAKLESQRTGGQVGGEASKAASGISELGNSLKMLRFVVGSSGLVKSLFDMGRAYKVFGERSDQIAGDFENLVKKIGIGAATLGPFGVILGSLSSIMDKLTSKANAQAEAQRKLAEAQEQATKEAEKAQKQLSDFKAVFQSLSEYRQDREIRRIADRGTDAERNVKKIELQAARSGIEAELELLKKDRPSEANTVWTKHLIERLKTIDSQISTIDSGLNAAARKEAQSYVKNNDVVGILGRMVELQRIADRGTVVEGNIKNNEVERNVKNNDVVGIPERIVELQSGNIDDVIEQLEIFQEAFETVNENIKRQKEEEYNAFHDRLMEEEDRKKALREAAEDWNQSERDYQASKLKDLEYFKGVMKEAAYAMEHVNSAEDFTKESSRFSMARSQIEAIQRETLNNAWKNLTSNPVSSYSALGFSMGETLSPISDIERQIDQIIRLMENQMKQSVQYVNPQYTL